MVVRRVGNYSRPEIDEGGAMPPSFHLDYGLRNAMALLVISFAGVEKEFSLYYKLKC